MCVDREDKRRIDERDLNNEMAERETGRIHRFLSGRLTDSEIQQKKEREAFETKLRQLLRDEVYARLYDDALSALASAQSALDAALLRNAEAVERLHNTLEDMEASAATLPNGEKVFRSKDGRAFTADGRELSGHDTANIDWPDGAPSYDAYLQAKWALDKARARGVKLSDVQTDVIDPSYRRLTDENDPPTPDDLRTITKTLKTLQDELEHPTASVDFDAAVQKPGAPLDEAGLAAGELSILPRPRL